MCETRYITRNGSDLLLFLGPSRRGIAAHLVDLRLFLRRRETKDTNANTMVPDGKETLSLFQMQSKRTRVLTSNNVRRAQTQIFTFLRKRLKVQRERETKEWSLASRYPKQQFHDNPSNMCCEASRLKHMYLKVYVYHVFSNVVVFVLNVVENEANGKQFSVPLSLFRDLIWQRCSSSYWWLFTLCDSR